MASNRIKGITIEIGGDSKKLQDALKGVDRQLKTTDANLKDVNKLLKLDPGNTVLLTQKQKDLQTAIKGTKDRLAALKKTQTESLSPEEYDALQREIIATEQDLKGLEDEYKEFGSVSAQQLKAVGEKVKQTGEKMTETGMTISKYVTAPIVAVGVAAGAAFNEVDAGMDIIVKKTGATGEALDELGGIMERIATDIPTDFETAGTAVGEVSTRFGVNGEELEKLSTLYIQFAKINDTDVTNAVDSTQKALAAFNLGAEDAGGYLDYLTKVVQKTGADVGNLSASVVSNATAFKEMGLDIYGATDLLGKLEMSGADSSAVMSGLSKALKKATSEGKPLDQALRDLQISMVTGTDDTKKLEKAYELFGKSGAQVFELVNSGAINFGVLAGAAEDASGTVVETFNATLDPADQFKTVMNALKETGASIAEVVMPLLSTALEKVKEVVLTLKEKWDGLDEGQKNTIVTIAGVVAAIGPAIVVIGKLVSGAGSLISMVGTFIGSVGGLLPGGAIIVGLVAAGTLIYKHWDEIKAWVVDTLIPAIRKAWEDLQPKIEAVFKAIKGFWTDTLEPALDAMWTWIVDDLIPAIQTAWENLQPKIEAVFTAIKGFWTDTLKPALLAMWTWITDDLLPAIQHGWEYLQPKIEAVFNAISSFWTETLKPVLLAMWTWITDDLLPAIQHGWEFLQPKIEAVFNAIKGFWNDILKPAFEAIQEFVEKTLGPIFENTFNGIKDVVSNSLNAISEIWKSVKKIYEGIVEFFTGVFSGDWDKAWKGIEDIVSGVWSAIQTAAEAAWENAKTWAETIIENFRIAWEAAWDIAKDYVTGVWDDITNKVKEIWEAAKQWGSNIIGNFYMDIVAAWNRAVEKVTGIWDDITNKVTEIWEAAKKWGTSIIGNFWNSISEAWKKAIENIKGLFDQIPQAIKELIDSAMQWGKDLIQNFVDGLKKKWEDMKQSVLDIPQKIHDWLGFSKPKEGPLSDFDTYAPDMMELFVKGISDSLSKLEWQLREMSLKVAGIFKQMGDGAYTAFNDALNGYWGDRLTNAIKNPFENAYNAVWNLEWWRLGYRIFDEVTYYCDWIKRAYENAFDFSHMYVKTPHWSVSSWNEISGTYYPNMRIDWYRKAYDNPILFTKPTVVNTPYGPKGFGDGAGGEVVLSVSKLRELAGAGDTNISMNIYAQPGQSVEQIAELAASKVQRIMVREENQRRAAYA